ncbi:MAG TPA: DHHA1 domain-containing protein [Bryobacteraceae bacterium]|nr:DHHA1 domain-containing protein [Bryobacteraceae bacterium]
MTDRLYYTDARLTSFRATVREARDGGRRVYLDRTAFYPSSGGQPSDRGVVAGIPVLDVIDEGEEIAHVLAERLNAREADCCIDWPRRFDHMQQHTGQHLLSAVFHERFGAATLSFHLGEQVSTIELAMPNLSVEQIASAEAAANEIIFENRPVRVTFEHAGEAAGLRKASQRGGTLRVVSIEGIDRSACGGTHVSSAGEIGPVLVRGIEKIRGNVRVEFVCGGRAIRRARADYATLTRAARVFSSAVDDVPDLASAQQAKLMESEKQRRKLAGECALRRGRDLYAGGERLHVAPVAAIDEQTTQEALGFSGNSGAIYIAVCENPPSILLAAAPDSGLHAGNTLKRLLSELGGKGGGSATMARGSVPSASALATVTERLRATAMRTGASPHTAAR